MKRYLLFVIAFVCVSIGTQIHAAATIGTTTWAQYNSYADMENVLTIYVSDPGDLATAIADQDFSNVQILHISARDRSSSLLALSPEDIAALSSVNVKTIEMMRAYVEPFTLTNSNVERIILPYNWTKEQVKAVGEANTSANFECCISANDQDAYDSRTGDAALIAYLSKPNTLKDAIMRTWNDTHMYAPLGNQVHQGGGDCSRLKYLTVMGNICARDISKMGVYDANGHYVTRGIPDENNNVFNINTEGEAYYVGMTTGPNASLVSSATPGALEANTGNLYYLDLRDASLPDEYAADIVFPYSQMGGTFLKEIWMPQDPGFKTVPADYLYISSNYVHQICIPGNIENIKTRAFAGTNIDYIWTTGDKDYTAYDNGAAFVSGDETTWKFMNNTAEGNIAMTEADYSKFKYGTITLPAGLRLIERFAFRSSEHVKDVYVLNEVAPECHVDAFSAVMYAANDHYDQSSITDEGIITRDAYMNNPSAYTFMTMLHYPRETGTPNTQRYTDPSREYSVATGERDGNGNMIYFPNQTEYLFAHLQGSYGYTWKAWDERRNWYDNEIQLDFQSLYQAQAATHESTRPDLQTRANDLWKDNPSTMLDDGHLEKYDRTFYDVTMGGNNQPNEVSAPSTNPQELLPYYQVTRRDIQLYPQAKYETSNYVYVRDDNGDYVKDPSNNYNTIFRDYTGSADDQLERYSRKKVPQTDGQGNIIYGECTDGQYVQDYEWARDDAEGDFVKENVQSGYSATQTLVDGVNTYYSDATGTTAVTPQVGEGMYVECGTDNDYTLINPDNETVGGRSQYYITSDGGQTYDESYLKFDINQIPTVYVKTNETTTNYYNTTVNQYNVLKFGVAHYYSDAEGQNEVTPTITSINGNGTLYFKDSEGEYHSTTTFVRGEGDYYVEYSHAPGTYYPIEDYNNQVYLDGVYYYGKEEDKYVHPEYYIPGTTYYNFQNWNNTYVEKTDGFGWHQISGAYTDYYYLSGSHTAYCNAQGEEYDANETYYSDQNGTVATTITLNGDYYIPTYVDVYREKTDGDVAPFYRKDYLNTYHLATAADAGEKRYCIQTEDYQASTPITYSVLNDYRGWHQFVLTAPAHNSTKEFEPLRSFITDNDWWTICAPYDLHYDDVVKFYGFDRQGFDKKIPYVSKLMYVIRDVEHQTITLMFSKNLMVYKEQRLAKDTQDGLATESRVHGYIDDETTYTDGEIAANPVILHAGVPYMIRPNLSVDDKGNINATRQFDIYKNQNPDLYERLKAAQEQGGTYQKNLIYNGMYTVPAYVVGESNDVTENTLADGQVKEIKMKDGTKFTYTNGTINYRGQNVQYKVSEDFTYTFVGSFYKNVMPQYCYFLGWDSEKNRAAFWYSRVQDTSGWNWNNETGVICPNFNTDLQIHGATGLDDPARWILATSANQQTNIKCDDFVVGTQASNAKQYTMDYGATMNLASVDEEPLAEDFGDQEVLSIDEIQSLDVKGEWYNVNGQKLNGRPTQSGVYIMGNKKYVVK